MKKRNQSILLILCLMLGLLHVVPNQVSIARGAPHLSVNFVVLKSENESKTVSIKNINKKKIKKLTVKSQNSSIATAKANGKTSFTISAACDDGFTEVNVQLNLKKKVDGKKKYRFSLDVNIVKAQPTETPAYTLAPTVTASPSASPAPTATVRPTATALPTATVKPSFTESPTPTVRPTLTPATSPTNTPAASTSPTLTEAQVYEKIIAMQSEYPEGKPWTNDNKYTWIDTSIPNHTIRHNFGGCAAFAAIMSDAGFGENAPRTKITNPNPSTIRVGDILRINNDSHSVIVLEIDDTYFVVAEGNFNNSIHWGRKLVKANTPISFVWTRWQ